MPRGLPTSPALDRTASLALCAALLAVSASCGRPSAEVEAPAPDSSDAPFSGLVAPPPHATRADAPWDRLAGWAAESYAALGFPDAPPSVRVDVLDEVDPREMFDRAAREFALEVKGSGAQAQTDTHWILRRAFNALAAESPDEQISREAERIVHATPLWYDRRLCAVRVIGAHPLFSREADAADAPARAAWEPWHLMAHEVAHALQDRRAPFRDRLDEPETYEANVVRKCLLEGEADLRMLALAAAVDGRGLFSAESSDEDERAWCFDELARLFDRETPSYYEAGFRYLLGELERGGWKAVEGAVGTPRITSRDLLAGVQAPREPISLVLPAWPGELASSAEHEWRDEVGAWGILALLVEAGNVDGDAAQDVELVTAWRADELCVVRRVDGITVLMWRVLVADEVSARALAERFAASDGTASFAGTTVDFAWSPVKQLELATLERLEAAR